MLQKRENKFAFFVDINSNKTEIKKAVQEKFNVKVLKVAIIRQNGKKANDCQKCWKNYKNLR